MNKYELVVALPGGFTPAKKKTAGANIEKLVKTGGGTVSKVNDWGKLKLAYTIGKEETGIFILFDLELDAESAAQLNTKLNLEEGIIRYLLVRQD